MTAATANDPNEAYEIVPCDDPKGWWRVTCNGAPVRLYAPEKRHLAERYISDPLYRQNLTVRKYHEK